MKAILSQAECNAFKQHISKHYQHIKSGHLTEAMARGMGYASNAALKEAFARSDDSRITLNLSDQGATNFLTERGYKAPLLLQEQYVGWEYGWTTKRIEAEILCHLEEAPLQEIRMQAEQNLKREGMVPAFNFPHLLLAGTRDEILSHLIKAQGGMWPEIGNGLISAIISFLVASRDNEVEKGQLTIGKIQDLLHFSHLSRLAVRGAGDQAEARHRDLYRSLNTIGYPLKKGMKSFQGSPFMYVTMDISKRLEMIKEADPIMWASSELVILMMQQTSKWLFEAAAKSPEQRQEIDKTRALKQISDDSGCSQDNPILKLVFDTITTDVGVMLEDGRLIIPASIKLSKWKLSEDPSFAKLLHNYCIQFAASNQITDPSPLRSKISERPADFMPLTEFIHFANQVRRLTPAAGNEYMLQKKSITISKAEMLSLDDKLLAGTDSLLARARSVGLKIHLLDDNEPGVVAKTILANIHPDDIVPGQ